MLHEETIQTGFEDTFCLGFQETRKYTTDTFGTRGR